MAGRVCGVTRGQSRCADVGSETERRYASSSFAYRRHDMTHYSHVTGDVMCTGGVTKS